MTSSLNPKEMTTLRLALEGVMYEMGENPGDAALLDKLKAAESANPTPPADDVREALHEAAMSVRMTAEGREVYVSRLVGAILAAPGIEVRPRGTATDAEVEAAVRRLGMDTGVADWVDRDSVRAALEAAAEARRA